MARPLIFLVAFILCISFVGAYVVGEQANIWHPVRLNGAVIPSAVCNITVENPKNAIIVSFAGMSYSANNAAHNYTLPASNTTTPGEYCYSITCTASGYNATKDDCIEITPSGQTMTTAQGITYSLIFAVVVSLFILALYGGFTISGENPRNEFNELIGVNYMKYVKSGCFYAAFFLFYLAIAIAQSISFAFLYMPMLSRFFTVLLQGLYIVMYLGIVFAFIQITLMVFNDKRIMKDVGEGIFKQ